MKRIKKYAMLLMATLGMGLLTSCETDPDTDRAMALSGQWYGDFGMYYNYQMPNGDIVTFDSYDTNIVFYPEYDYACYGWGKQIDYYQYGPYEYQYYQFYWEMRNGVITLRYPYDPELNTSIYDYRLSYDWFTGYFNGSATPFRLRKLADYYNWSVYTDTYGYGWRDSWGYPYYAKGQKSETDTTSTQQSEGKIVGRGNRYNKTDK